MEGWRGPETKKRHFVPAMDCVFGVVGNGFAAVAGGAPAVVSGGAMLNLLEGEKDRAVRLNSHTLLGASGRVGDCAMFKAAVKESVCDNNDTAAVAGVAHVAVRACAFAVDAMVAGYDEGVGPSLYCVGPSSPLRRVEKGALRCGSNLCAAVMETHYHTGMTVREAVAVIDKCIRQLRRLDGVSFVIKIVDKDGAREYARRTHIKESHYYKEEIDNDSTLYTEPTNYPYSSETCQMLF